MNPASQNTSPLSTSNNTSTNTGIDFGNSSMMARRQQRLNNQSGSFYSSSSSSIGTISPYSTSSTSYYGPGANIRYNRRSESDAINENMLKEVDIIMNRSDRFLKNSKDVRTERRANLKDDSSYNIVYGVGDITINENGSLKVPSGSGISAVRSLVSSSSSKENNERGGNSAMKYYHQLNGPASNNSSDDLKTSTTTNTSQTINNNNKATISKIPCGLENTGNSCFINSVLQCLFHTPSLSNYFTNGVYNQHISSHSKMKGNLAESFAETLNSVVATSNSRVSGGSMNPGKLKRVIGRFAPNFEGYIQQDCQEFMRFLVDGLAEDLNYRSSSSSSKKPETISDEILSKMSCDKQSDYWWLRHKTTVNDSYITDLFAGQFRSTIECCKCNKKSFCFDPFYDLSVSIPTSSSTNSASSILKPPPFTKRKPTTNQPQNSVTIEACLKTFTSPETLTNVTCSDCKSRRTHVKTLTIYKLPKILVIHIKRFTAGLSKLNTHVVFGTEIGGLDMSLYSCSEEKEKGLYDLYAVCNHIGGVNGGHYTASCCVEKEWFCFNDRRVERMDVGSFGKDGLPYVLFYKRRD